MEQIENLDLERINRLQKTSEEDYKILLKLLQKFQKIDGEQFYNYFKTYANEFINPDMKKFKNLFESEPIFADFFYAYKKRTEAENLVNQLIESKILRIINDEYELTYLGKVLFSIHTNDEKIVVKKKSINNKLYYVNEAFFDIPLYQSIDKLSNYIYNSIPDFQIRTSAINSYITKFVDLDVLKKALKYIITHSEITTPEMLKIEINKKYLKFDFLESNKYLKIFEKIWGNIDSYDTLVKYFAKKSLEFTNEKQDEYRSFRIQLYPVKLDFERDWIDDVIIEMAYNNEKFKRKSIDEKFEISSRNSNYRLSRLIDAGILDKEGTGKATTYFLKHGLNQFDEI